MLLDAVMTYDNGPVIAGDYCRINVTNLSLPPVVVGLTMSNEVVCSCDNAWLFGGRVSEWVASVGFL